MRFVHGTSRACSTRCAIPGPTRSPRRRWVLTRAAYGITAQNVLAKEDSGLAEHEQAYLTLQAIVDAASRTVLRVNQEPQNPTPELTEFLSGKRQEGWEVAGIAPSGVHLLRILKRPLS
jgi:hypothetical protein